MHNSRKNQKRQPKQARPQYQPPQRAVVAAVPAPTLFDPVNWVQRFRAASDRRDYNAIRALRIDIAEQTVACSRRGSYPLVDGREVTIATPAQLKAQIKGCEFYTPHHLNRALRRARRFDAPTVCEVIQGDCLEAAIALKVHHGLKPAVLNMASAKRPGGGYMTGAGAQEENIFRRSNYHQSLEDPQRIDAERRWRYPLQPLCGIYSPDVRVFRSSEDAGYAFLDEPITLDFIAVAAVSNPSLLQYRDGSLRINGRDADLMMQKMRIILDIALTNGHDAVVLSAFGCGAFCNPPHHVASLFRTVITDHGYANCFRRICFAVFDDQNARRAHNPDGNVEPFRSVFAKPLDPVPPLTLEDDLLGIDDPDP